MNENLSLLWRDKLIRLTLIGSVFISVITAILVFIFYHKLPPLIPFFNSMPWGSERLTNSYYVLGMPAVFFLIMIVNNSIGVAIYESHTLLARILSTNAFLFVLFGFLAYLEILFLVF